MPKMPLALLPHRVTIEAPREGSEGPSYGPPVRGVRCRLDGRIDVTAEAEHVSTLKMYALPEVARLLVVGARVTTPRGNRALVSAVALHEDGGLGGWEHVEATLTGGQK